MNERDKQKSAAPAQGLQPEQQSELQQRIESLQSIVVQLLAENERLRQKHCTQKSDYFSS